MNIQPVSQDYKKPFAWIVCAHCNDMLDCEVTFFDALDVKNMTLEDVHIQNPITNECRQRNELACIDVYNLPTTEIEMPIARIKAWAELMDKIDPNLEDVFSAWAESNIVRYDENRIPDYTVFMDTFIGVFVSFQEFTDGLAEDALEGLPFENIRRYFDYDRFCEDQILNYTDIRLASGEYAVFKRHP